MARTMTRAALVLDETERLMLIELAASRKAAPRQVLRAQVLLDYAGGKSPTEIQRLHGVSRPTIYKCIDKALAAGVLSSLKDEHERARAPRISEAACAWVVDLACARPADLGLPGERWTLSALAGHVAAHAAAQGFARLERPGKATIWRILNAPERQANRARYRLARRDAHAERHKAEVLMLYCDIQLYRCDAPADGQAGPSFSVGVGEKPGTPGAPSPNGAAPPAPPRVGRKPARKPRRGSEHVRVGSLSLLAALDLHTGQIISHVGPRHTSTEFTGLLQQLHAHYPDDARIRIVLDKHRAHIAKPTMAWLARHPARFDYIHAPRHGSWLNLMESIFSRMARSFLHHIRAASLAELRQCILLGIGEMNAQPVRFKWKSFDLEMTAS